MKKSISIFMAVALLLLAALPVSAAQGGDTVLPMYMNANDVNMKFVIDENGIATIRVTGDGNNKCTGFYVVTYLEHWANNTWNRVNIGTANNQWTYSTSQNMLLVTYNHTVTEAGEYRAVSRVLVYGTGQNESILLTRVFEL